MLPPSAYGVLLESRFAKSDARSITARSLAKMSSSATPATSSVSVTSDLPPPNALTALDNVMPLTKTVSCRLLVGLW